MKTIELTEKEVKLLRRTLGQERSSAEYTLFHWKEGEVENEYQAERRDNLQKDVETFSNILAKL